MGIFDFFKKKKDEAPSFPDSLAPGGDNFGLGQEMPGLDNGFGNPVDPTGLDAFTSQRNQIPPTLERMQHNEMQYPSNTYARGRPFEQQPNPQQNELLSKNIEIISYKIDALRAAMDTLNQRMANLEAMAKGQQDGAKYRW